MCTLITFQVFCWGFFPSNCTIALVSTLLNLIGGLWRIVQFSPKARAGCWTPIGHLGEQRGSAEAAVRILLFEVSVHFHAAGQAVHKILQEVTAEDHIYPRVAAAVETGKQCRESHRCVLRIYRTKRKWKILKASGADMAI